MASSILAITGNDLPFASLGGKYPRLELNQLGLCHARHTKIEATNLKDVASITIVHRYFILLVLKTYQHLFPANDIDSLSKGIAASTLSPALQIIVYILLIVFQHGQLQDT